MAPHDGAEQAEERSPLRLPNKIADSDPNKNRRIRQNIENDVNRGPGFSLPCFLQNISVLTTLLPPHWRKLPPELKQFVEKEMFDPVMRQVLEDENIINWAPSATKLFPLITTGDGNCLLHAISLAMWGIEDDDMFLRNLLHEALVGNNMESRKRWQRERKKLDERIPGSGLRYNTMEWRNEWEMVIAMASAERRPANSQGLPYECLEEFHVFMLANILRRPIIVMAQPMWHDLQGHSLQPQNFNGVYLPLKWQPEECNKLPIILGYYQMHFVPLVYTDVAEGETPATDFVVPLINRDHSPLTIHFLSEQEEGTEDTLLQNYLTIEEIPHMDINESMASAHVIQGAKLSTNTPPDETNLMISYFKLVDSHYRFYLETEYNPQNAVRGATQTQQGQLQDQMSQVEDKMSKANLYDVPQPQRSDMWSPAANPNYNSNVSTNVQAQRTNEVSHPQGAAAGKSQVIHSMIDQSCKTKDCPYYRSVSTGEYCHECYNRLKMSTETKSTTGPVKCRTEGCLNFSEPDQEHCQVCTASAKFQGNVGSVTAPSAPLPSNILFPSEQHALVGERIPEANLQTAKPYQSAHITSNASDDLTTLMVNTVRVGSRKCIMPECQLTGHPDTSDMCRKCFEENRKIHENVMSQTGTATLERPPQIPQQMPQTSAPSDHVYKPRICRTLGCKGLGNSHMNGYCVECSLKMSPTVTGERPQYPQTNTAAPPSIPPPNYAQAVKMLQRNTEGYPNNAAQQGYATGYSNSSPPHQNPVITVQKHICSTPGCLGVRLDTGYCWECEKKNKLSMPPQRTQTPPPTPTQSWVTSPKRRSQTPPVPSAAATRQLQSAGYGYPSRNPQPPTNRSYQGPTKTVPQSHPSTNTCRHPKCDRPAAPPKYLLCEECIQIAELYRRDGNGDQYGTGMSTQPLLPPNATPWTADDMEQPPRNQAMQEKTKPRASPSKKATPPTRAYIPRHKCQAPGGCKDDMFGDPELNNLCSTCFKDSLMRPPFQKPSDVHSAPLKPSARITQRQTSHSQVLPPPQPRVVHVPSHSQAGFGNQVIIGTGPSPAMVQVGQVPLYQKCSTIDCQNPANPNILDGLCNNCYRTYNDFIDPRPHDAGLAQPSQAAPNPHYQEPRRAVPGQTAQPYGYREKPVDLPTPKPTKIPCKHDWCYNFGNPRCFGYCNECYKLTQMNRTGQIPH